jgi:hypothetical protein
MRHPCPRHAGGVWDTPSATLLSPKRRAQLVRVQLRVRQNAQQRMHANDTVRVLKNQRPSRLLPRLRGQFHPRLSVPITLLCVPVKIKPRHQPQYPENTTVTSVDLQRGLVHAPPTDMLGVCLTASSTRFGEVERGRGRCGDTFGCRCSCVPGVAVWVWGWRRSGGR